MRKWWFRRHRQTTKNTQPLETVFPTIEKFGETLTPNLRALRLALTTSDVLLSMGISANSVVSKALDITETYCERPVHVDVSANLLMLSQLRGIEKEPLTLIRPVTLRSINYMTIQAVQHLIYNIRTGHYTLEKAEVELDRILDKPSTYPWWVIMIANGAIVGGVSLMFTSAWRVIMVTFIIGMLVDRLMALMIRRSIPAFFRQVGAAAFVTLAAALIALLARSGISFFNNMNPTLIVVGGIIMLVAGLVIVGAIQDAIEEYYLTATARVMKVGMLTVGIVIGILIALYTARKLGFGIAVSPNPLHMNDLHLQIIGAAVSAAAYAVATQTRIRAIIWAGILGGGSLAIMYASRHLGISVIPASGVSAVFIGIVAAFFSHLWRTPSAGIIAAAIVPLVPGLALYNGLMQLVNYPPGDPLFVTGLGTLFTAIATALTIAAGASFGNMFGRPIQQKITHNRNFIPFMSFMGRQLGFNRRHNLGRTAVHSSDMDTYQN
jgi:uncharacterized membrane protein YjjP (DUF1212 family)